jgi:hypothetical protein
VAHRFPAKTFIWDCGDFPTGRLPGLYCSLPRERFDEMRHRSFCYYLRHNECVSGASLDEAQYLFGFTGQVSSPLRARMFAALASEHSGGKALLRQTDGALWATILVQDAAAAKQAYARDLARCKFIICPRGNGACSIRLFEAMEAGRVPVILSDRWVPPSMVDWSRCSVRISENALARLPEILRERESDWPILAVTARRTWEKYFSDASLLATITTQLTELTQIADVHRRWSMVAFFRRLAPAVAITAAKRARQQSQRLLRARRAAKAKLGAVQS